MPDDVAERIVTLAFRATKMSAGVMSRAMQHYLQKRGQTKSMKHSSKDNYRGRMTIKELMKDRAGLNSMEINDENIKGFEKTARKYGIEYALRKDATQTPPQYLVFFKGKDADVIHMAFKEFVHKRLKTKDRPSVRTKIQELRGRNKMKDRERADKTLSKTQEKIKKREVIR